MNLRTTLFAICLLITAPLMAQEGNKRPGCLDELDIPQSVAPCGDGINTGWSIYFPCAPEKFSIVVFNRWGEELFSSDDYRFIWYAMDQNGQRLPSGVYVFRLDYTYMGEEKRLTGEVSIIC